MPLPKTKDVGKIIRFLKKEKPGMDRDQRVAIALEHARSMGASIPKKHKKKKLYRRKR
jgi:hypothetical protein